MRIGTVKKYIDKIYNADELDIRNRLLIVLIIGIMIGDVLGTITDIVNGLNTLAFNLCMLLVCAISLVSCLKFKAYRFAMIFTVVAIDFGVLPSMFFSEGGIHSGMILWFFMSVIMTFLMLQGVVRYVITLLCIIMDVVLFWVAYYNPQYVSALGNETEYMTDVTISFASTTIIMCLLVLIHIRSYELQKTRIEQQWKDLKESQDALEKALEKAQSADRAKSDFLANMSHEIRTPINAVLGMDEMILREAEQPEIIEYASNIDSSGRALLAIINDILDFSKIESGRMEFSSENYQISSLVNDSANMIISRIQEKGLEFRVTNNPDIPCTLLGDESRVRQMTVNLLTNACKYTNTGTVTLNLDYENIDDENLTLKISVEDTGIGIREENLNELFKSFRRIDLKQNRRIEGTGLGLALTKSLAEQFGGSISVSSEYGKGSKFTIEIPQKIVDRTPVGKIDCLSQMETHEEYRESFTAPEACILAVDDMKLNLKVLAGLLKKTMVGVDMALSGRECLEMVKRKHYDLIFMDHMMPEMDGIETFRQMRGDSSSINADTPVIVLTANAIQGVKEKYLSEGFTDYMSKPIKPKGLESMMVKYLPADKVIIAGNE